jgi:hypothetical protein
MPSFSTDNQVFEAGLFAEMLRGRSDALPRAFKGSSCRTAALLDMWAFG